MYTILIFIAGAVSVFIISDKALHAQLRTAKNARQVASLLGKSIVKHGKEVGHKTKRYVTSNAFQQKLVQGKRLVADTFHNITKSLKS